MILRCRSGVDPASKSFRSGFQKNHRRFSTSSSYRAVIVEFSDSRLCLARRFWNQILICKQIRISHYRLQWTDRAGNLFIYQRQNKDLLYRWRRGYHDETFLNLNANIRESNESIYKNLKMTIGINIVLRFCHVFTTVFFTLDKYLSRKSHLQVLYQLYDISINTYLILI